MMTNLQRKGGLHEMLHLCAHGLDAEEHAQMVENITSMTDLTDGEFSPQNSYTEEQIITQCDQCSQAFELAMVEIRRMEAEDSDGETMETAEGRYYRYINSSVSEVSDPGYWYDVHGHAEGEESEPIECSDCEDEQDGDEPQFDEDWESRKHRYSLIERHEASDQELWDDFHNQAMIEVVGEQFMEGPAVDFREYLGERSAAAQSSAPTDESDADETNERNG